MIKPHNTVIGKVLPEPLLLLRFYFDNVGSNRIISQTAVVQSLQKRLIPNIVKLYVRKETKTV